MGNKRSVLVADDDRAILDFLDHLLSKAGFDVVCVEDGKQALDALSKRHFDLHLVDIWMPKLNGVEVLRRIQGTGEVLMMSGHATPSTRDKVRELGALDFIEKPLDPPKIVEAVKKALAGDRIVRLRRQTRMMRKGGAADVSGPSSGPRAPGGTAVPVPPTGEEGRELEQIVRTATATAGPPAAPSKGRRVLVADDDDTLRALMKKVLTSKGYDVVTAQDGQEAYEKCVVDHIDIAVMDINMPRLNGIEAAQKLHQYDPNLFILVVTGEATKDEQESALKVGGAIILHKPFDLHQFVQRVEGLDFIAQKGQREKERLARVEQQWKNRGAGQRLGDWWREKRSAYPRASTYAAIVLIALICSQVAVRAQSCVSETRIIPRQMDIEYWLERISSGIEADWGR